MSAYYTFEDLSGSTTPVISDNPYTDLIAACHDDSTQIQNRYNIHRTNRNAQQRARLLAPDFHGVTVDEILAKLEDSTNDPDYEDWRNCLVFWARPPERIRDLIAEVQKRLLVAAPSLWTMPSNSLHMTAMEITHSLTAKEIEVIVEKLLPGAQEIADFTVKHRARLVKPMLSYDAQALALSFLPAAGEGDMSSEKHTYTYHHLRRDLFTKIQANGVKVVSRYVIPSAHLTVARFITKQDFETDGNFDQTKMERFIATIDGINDWLQQYWPQGENSKEGGEWTVGEEKGLDFRKGTLWYGDGGETVHLGKGF